MVPLAVAINRLVILAVIVIGGSLFWFLNVPNAVNYSVGWSWNLSNAANYTICWSWTASKDANYSIC